MASLNSRRRRRVPARSAVVCLGLATVLGVAALRAGERGTADSSAAKAASATISAVEKRLGEQVNYLASDELEGRGLGTKGINRAADYIADEFRKMGLKTELFDGSPFQRFQYTLGAKLGKKNLARLEPTAAAKVGEKTGDKPAANAKPANNKQSGEKADGENKPDKPVAWKLGREFTPLALGGSGKIDAPLVFVGYGITAKEQEYDDFAGIDLKGKVAVILRKNPQQADHHGAFASLHGPSPHATYRSKLANARQHGAAAVIFVNDHFSNQQVVERAQKQWESAVDQMTKAQAEYKKIKKPSGEDFGKHRKKIDALAGQLKAHSQTIDTAADSLLNFRAAQGSPGGKRVPVLHVRRAAIEPLIRATFGKDLKSVEAEIDEHLKPKSAELGGWKLAAEIEVERTETEAKNVVAVLEGEGPHADETVIVGAHYDHLGYGGMGSFVPNVKAIHNGADDNASGTVALLEVARQLSERQKKLPRRIVFIAFTAEESGLVGSGKYVNAPLYPLDDTIAMLNMDMVGRLDDEKLIVHGTGTAKGFAELLKERNDHHKFKITEKPSGFGPSDHQTFYIKKVPVLHFFTGTHRDYHRPTDDVEKLNLAGIRRVASLVAEMASSIAAAEARPEYLVTKAPRMGNRGGSRPYFGSIPDFSSEQEGYAIGGAAKGSPAAEAGLKAGDVIVKLADSKITGLDDFDLALRKHKPGESVPVVVLRDGKMVTLKVTLAPPR